MNEAILTWEEYEKDIYTLIAKIEKKAIAIDAIIGIGRNGLVPAIYISNHLNLPMGVVMAGRYDGKKGGEIRVSNALSIIQSKPIQRVIAVDEIADQGLTLQAINGMLKNMFSHVDFAVVYYKACSSFIPNYYAKQIDNDIWVRFPFEGDDND